MSLGARFGIELVDQVDGVKEASASTVSDVGAANGHREMCLSGPGSSDQHGVALVLQEVSASQISRQCLIDWRLLKVEFLEFLG